MNNDDIYKAVAQDGEILEHYGRIGMKWYQHIYGDYQGAAKYAEKGEKKLAASKQRDNFRGTGKSNRTKKLENKVKAVKQEAKAAKKRQEEKEKENAEKQAKDKQKQKEKEADRRAVVEAKAKAEHEKKILDLAHGKADWRTATADELLEAVGRMEKEKQFKQLRDEVSGAKVWKESGSMALKSVAGNMGNIVNTISAPTAKAIAENWSKNKDFERKKETDAYNDKRKEEAAEKRKKEESEAAAKEAKSKPKSEPAPSKESKPESGSKSSGVDFTEEPPAEKKKKGKDKSSEEQYTLPDASTKKRRQGTISIKGTGKSPEEIYYQRFLTDKVEEKKKKKK